MGKFSGMLLASDYDGTLDNDEGVITDDTRQSIKYFIDNGGLFTVCTGRSWQGFPYYDPELINAPVILANGSLIYDYAAGRVLYDAHIDKKAGIDCVRLIMDKFPDASVEMYALGKTYCIRPREMNLKHFNIQFIDYDIVASPEETTFPWNKIMIGSDPQTGLLIQKFLRENVDDPAFLATYASFVELMKKGVNKATGLRELTRVLDLSDEHVFAIGDGMNDAEMLAAAAVSFAPSNGEPEALAAAGHIVCSNNDGDIREAIELIGKLSGGNG